MKNNAATINNSLRLLWVAVGGKEDIAYNNFLNSIRCMLSTPILNTPVGIPGRYGEITFIILPSLRLNKEAQQHNKKVMIASETLKYFFYSGNSRSGKMRLKKVKK